VIYFIIVSSKLCQKASAQERLCVVSKQKGKISASAIHQNELNIGISTKYCASLLKIIIGHALNWVNVNSSLSSLHEEYE